jgi:hypothetical protein
LAAVRRMPCLLGLSAQTSCRMDETTKLLQEIRDILRRDVEDRAVERSELKQWRTAHDARVELSITTQVAQARLYRRVVTVGAVLILALLLILFSVLSR